MMVSVVLLSALVFAIAVSLIVTRRQQRQLDQAERKGMELLLKNLSTRQRQQYEAFGYFDVSGSDTGRRYRIVHGKF